MGIKKFFHRNKLNLNNNHTDIEAQDSEDSSSVTQQELVQQPRETHEEGLQELLNNFGVNTFWEGDGEIFMEENKVVQHFMDNRTVELLANVAGEF